MIPRYELPEMAAIFSDTARFGRWLEIELLATEAWAALGVVPAADAAACRAAALVVDDDFVAAVDERERVTDHDVAAFVDVVQQRIGEPGRWIHYGLTSSDVVDTALCWALRDAADLLIAASSDLIAVLKRVALEHRDTITVGRTHGVHAEPTTFGVKVALWCLQADRDRARLRAARDAVAVAKLSGAVGTYSNIDPAVERHVAGALGLTPGAGHAGRGARPPRRVPLGVRRRRGHRRADRPRAAPPPAHRGARGGGGLPGRSEGLVGHAPQAQPDHRRAAVRPGPHPAGQPPGRHRGRRPVARARHLPLVGGAGHPAGLVACWPTTCCAGRPRSSGTCASTPIACWPTSGRATASCSRSRCCSPSSPAAWSATTPTASCRSWPGGRGRKAWPSARLLEKDERVRLTEEDLDEVFDLARAVRNTGATFEALDAVDA